MLLSGKQIIEKKIIDSEGPNSVRQASYDLRVGEQGQIPRRWLRLVGTPLISCNF